MGIKDVLQSIITQSSVVILCNDGAILLVVESAPSSEEKKKREKKKTRVAIGDDVVRNKSGPTTNPRSKQRASWPQAALETDE